MQIKHGGCCLSVCRGVHALINLYNFSRHKWGCYRFCVTGLALEHWLIGYGWIIHLNHGIGAWLCGPCQWVSGVDRLSSGNGMMIWEREWSTLSTNFGSSAQMLHLLLPTQWILAPIQYCFFLTNECHTAPESTFNMFSMPADELFSTAAVTL